jgi:6,7-dimethyl-8-ribityllumazine synthase
MAGAGARQAIPRAQGARVVIVEARFHAAIGARLVAGARAALAAAGAVVSHRVVPGALEIPAAIARLHATGAYDAYVALGCVVRGETFHFEIVAGESARGLVDLGTRHGLAIGNGILTVDTLAQAEARADPAGQDKGGAAAVAALALLALDRPGVDPL